MPFVPAICTQCNAEIQVDPSRDAAFCLYCGTPFVVEKAVNLYQTTNNITAQTVNIVAPVPDRDFEIRAGVLVKYHGAAREVVVPEGVVAIGGSAFEGCKWLEKVAFPSGLKAIGDKAFSECSSLRYIEIPTGVTQLGSDAFARCKALTAIVIPNGVTRISNHAFAYCTALTTATIPDGIKWGYDSAYRVRGGVGVFSGCVELNNVNISNDTINTLRTTRMRVSGHDQRSALVEHFWDTPFLEAVLGKSEIWKLKGLCIDGKSHEYNLFEKCKKCGNKKLW